MTLDVPVAPNSPAPSPRRTNRPRIRRPFPSNVAVNGAVAMPRGNQPAPPYQYASPASGPPLPLVSKFRSEPSS